MNEKLSRKIKASKVKEMKNPTILMNSQDLKFLVDKGEVIGSTLNDIPITSREYVEPGQIIIFDDASLSKVKHFLKYRV